MVLCVLLMAVSCTSLSSSQIDSYGIDNDLQMYSHRKMVQTAVAFINCLYLLMYQIVHYDSWYSSWCWYCTHHLDS